MQYHSSLIINKLYRVFKERLISSLSPSLITEFNWGLIPSFCKTEMDAKDMQSKTLNAKCETGEYKLNCVNRIL